MLNSHKWLTTNYEILKALGLDKQRVRYAEIVLNLGSMPTVLCEIELADENGLPLIENGAVVTELQKYELVRVKDS